MDVFESTKDLVEEVLYELFFERARGEKTVEISAEELSDEVTVLLLALFRGIWGALTYMSSSGEMKMSLREMT
jgi:hypothetical protein